MTLDDFEEIARGWNRRNPRYPVRFDFAIAPRYFGYRMESDFGTGDPFVIQARYASGEWDSVTEEQILRDLDRCMDDLRDDLLCYLWNRVKLLDQLVAESRKAPAETA
jgi:hypothetical protein